MCICACFIPLYALFYIFSSREDRGGESTGVEYLHMSLDCGIIRDKQLLSEVMVVNLKILHSGDFHIGLRFGNYPEAVRNKLAAARVEALRNLVGEANSRQCDLLVVAGDLFEGHRVARATVAEAAEILNGFAGPCVLVLPGNHDYYDDVLWPTFERQADPAKVVVLKQCQVYELAPWGLAVDVFAAPCFARHSDSNNLAWIGERTPDPARFNLGIAHGTLAGLSLDMEGMYYPMSEGELRAAGLDLWLLGHAHVRYPDEDRVDGATIFNAGTPEPDGMNFQGRGNAWLLHVDAEKRVRGESIPCGMYRFLDLAYQLTRDFSPLEQELLVDGADRFLVRLTLRGSLEDDVLAKRADVYSRLEKHLFYVDIEDSRLGRRISREILDREFTAQSFPHRLLSKLADDSEALQIAYELVREVKEA